jgi:hypothetical protein
MGGYLESVSGPMFESLYLAVPHILAEIKKVANALYFERYVWTSGSPNVRA